MRYKELRAVAEYLRNFKRLNDIQRVGDNLIRAQFDKTEIFFDLGRSKNLIYMRDDFVKTKHYNAPFDKVLAKFCKKSFIEKIELDEKDKILRIHCAQRSSYKEQKAILQLEFTGRHANAVIVDEKGKVLEALHHDFHRDLKPGRPLIAPVPPKKLDRSSWKPDDMEAYLHKVYEEERQKRLSVLKSAKLLQLNKQKAKLQELLEGLEKEEELSQEADEVERQANIVLANIHAIKPYQKEFVGKDFEGEDVAIPLPKEAKSAAHAADLLFAKAKKLRQKAKNIHIRRQNLQEKIDFLEKKAQIVRNAKRIEDIELLFHKLATKESKKDKNYEKYIIDGYPVYIGKNRQGNVELLKKAKAGDIWMHLKDLPSAHVIIQTNKQNLPEHILRTAAELCAKFSVKHGGRYLVDYTQRRNVKPKEGSNVEYVKYKTIGVII
ncbi:MAG: hypothetical protein C6H99_00075 [Epsilonproteobacteria bacterium]|nr:hypothetical protein [Campylobacterota bacterium]NPA64310.1 DUF814 domain-containing protein [Campylobacterota bacterium]